MNCNQGTYVFFFDMGSLFSLTLVKNKIISFWESGFYWFCSRARMVLVFIGFGFLGNIERVVFLPSFIFPVNWTLL